MNMERVNLFGLTTAILLGLGSAASSETVLVGTAGIPSGFGLSGGSVGLTASGSFGSPRNPPIDNTRFDASASLLTGFGDPVSGLGFQAGLNVTSVRNFGESGYLTLGVHKMFQTNEKGVFSVALNATHVAPWGNATVLDPGYSLVGSYLTSVSGRLAVFSAGAATDTNANRDVEGVIGMGIGIADAASFSVGQVGAKSVVGMSFSPQWLGGSSLSVSVNHNHDTSRNTLVVDLARVFNIN